MKATEIIAVIQAYERGEPIESRAHGKEWGVDDDPCWDFFNGEYRIKPEPKLVPLTAEDVPPGSVVRGPGLSSSGWSAVLASGHHIGGVKGVLVGDVIGTVSYQALFEQKMEIKRPGGEWLPCSKPA